MLQKLYHTPVSRVILIVLVIISASVITAIVFLNKPISVEEVDSPLDPMQDPLQIDDINEPGITYQSGNLNVIYFPQASYEITAKVMSKKKYHDGWSAKIGPYDFVLAWGNPTKPEMKNFIKYSQMRRFYFYKCTWDCPLTQEYISTHSANTHLIPANDNILKVLRKIKKGTVIKLWGYLINVEGTYKEGNVSWRSSTTQKDTGNGACEVMYVEKVRLKNKIYR
ncbi:MAG TPA: hypothetical protein ENG70_01865 [Candidatus Cloacimonetes bacterium]|nr:hypothetical protein [Candidatus Cloacimonadota bacterium]HEX37597.1 hypothetical protein [Candidatus Cloacimonadota bacterium]